MNNEPRQKIMETLGKSGCYFLAIVHLAEDIMKRTFDALQVFLAAIKLGYVKEDCFITMPEKMLEMLTENRWTVMKADKDAPIIGGSYEILRFERTDPSGTYPHFVVGDGMGKVAWDPYGDSRTVREGKLISKRIFRRC